MKISVHHSKKSVRIQYEKYPKEFFAPLCVLLVESCEVPVQRVPGLPDEVFIRGNSLEFWQEFLGLEGVLADEPGDQLIAFVAGVTFDPSEIHRARAL